MTGRDRFWLGLLVGWLAGGGVVLLLVWLVP